MGITGTPKRKFSTSESRFFPLWVTSSWKGDKYMSELLPFSPKTTWEQPSSKPAPASTWSDYGLHHCSQNLWKQKLKILLSLCGCSSPEVIKLFSCSTQLSMKSVLLINLKLLTIAYSFLLNIAEHEYFPAINMKMPTIHFHIY